MLEKTVQAYKLANEFCSLMAHYQENQKIFSDVEKSPAYSELERQREQLMKEDSRSTKIGALLYLARHPKKMFTAQKYYSSDFGKPCPIGKR